MTKNSGLALANERFERDLPPLRHLTRLPDPEPEELWCPIISAEDHVFEPPTLFDRVPQALRDRAPRLVELHGRPAWEVDGVRYYVHGMDGSSGRPLDEARAMAIRYEEFRQGVFDPVERVKDMDLVGVWASVVFPSVNWFSGSTLSSIEDPEVALACVRAYNDWLIDDWCGVAPERFIPSQIPFLADPALAAEEVRRNAARGYRCVGFSENPRGLGFPGLHSDHWDPFYAACVETGTVINLHPGSSHTKMSPSPDAPVAVSTALFPFNSATAIVDWIYSGVTLRFPDIRIVMSGGGMSWVPVVAERLERAHRLRDECRALPGSPQPWPDDAPTPVDALRTNFWFSSNEDPLGFQLLDLVGDTRVMMDMDYPHPDASWPHTQRETRAQLEKLPIESIRRVCFETAAALYDHQPPPDSMYASSVVGRSELEEGRDHAQVVR